MVLFPHIKISSGSHLLFGDPSSNPCSTCNFPCSRKSMHQVNGLWVLMTTAWQLDENSTPSFALFQLWLCTKLPSEAGRSQKTWFRAWENKILASSQADGEEAGKHWDPAKGNREWKILDFHHQLVFQERRLVFKMRLQHPSRYRLHVFCKDTSVRSCQ